MDKAPNVEFLTPGSQVRMANSWFALADPAHFWMLRRFDVLMKIAGPALRSGQPIAEVGCGNGAVQRLFEDRLGVEVDGFDLNACALQQSIARKSRVCCYNILDRRSELAGKYSTVLLLDVLEHIEEEQPFLDALFYHIADGGRAVLNVPADPLLFSAYDVAQGHCRRYLWPDFSKAITRARLQVTAWTYWGLPYYPLLLARRFALSGKTDEKEIVERGFQPPAPAVNRLLKSVGGMEPFPNRLRGTSLMAVVERRLT